MDISKDELKELVSKYYPELNKKEMDIFLSISKYYKAKNKTVILKSGRTVKSLIFILKGVARAYSINDKGQELNDHIRAEGHLMGDARVFGDKVQILNIEAIGEIHYLIFDVKVLETLGYKNPEIMTFYLNFLKEINSFFFIRNQDLINQQFENAVTRVWIKNKNKKKIDF